jgi:hypothetical protein
VPTVEDWVKVENVCQVLEVFNEVTKIISWSNYPTANLFLPEVWRIRDVLGKKCRDENVYIRTMAQKMNMKFEKYWGECNLLMAVGAVLDPRFKMKLVQFCFPEIYQEPEATRNIERVHRVLNELYGECVDDHNLSIAGPQRGQESFSESSSTTSDSSASVIRRSTRSGMAMFQSFVRSVDTFQRVKSDLEVYLEEDVYICDEGADLKFDALEWWKFNQLKYHILSKMVRDVLAIPISIVASESTFSAGGRVIDPYSASLATKTVEMLLCSVVY